LKGTHAANLSLGLAAVSPLLLYCSYSLWFAWVTPADISRMHLAAHVVFSSSIAAVAASFWFSGFAFSVAPRRSLAAMLMDIAAVVGLWFI
jgi:hypothetical protein